MSSTGSNHVRGSKRAGGDGIADLELACDQVGEALDTGKLGEIVAKHEHLILQYYKNVRDEAKQSFASARMVAYFGFWILVGTLTYALLFDALTRIGRLSSPMADMSMTVGRLGVVSGALIEFIAGIQFWLYARAARQFGAFHVCLERTHRYLLAYKIAGEIGSGRDDTLHKLVCIMANAPMIGRNQTDLTTQERSSPSAHLAAVSAEVTQA